jgi:CheY-like chemotaxis protein
VASGPQPQARPPVDPAPLAGARILLAEDNQINQEVAVAMMNQVGIAVDVASDGSAAVQQAAQARYDAILMDMQMPVMDGLQATRVIRGAETQGRTPIIAMTASASADDRARCLAAGMDDHLAKPVEPGELWRVLLRWVPATGR